MLRRNLTAPASLSVDDRLMLVGLPDRVSPAVRVMCSVGQELGAGPPEPQGGRRRRLVLEYVVPGVLLVAIGSAVQGTSIMVAMDMTGGIIDRFRTMAIARASF